MLLSQSVYGQDNDWPVVPLGSEARVRVDTWTVPARTLPGLPVGIYFTVHNEGTQAVSVGNCARLEITLGSGEILDRMFGSERCGIFEPFSQELRQVAPGASVDGAFPLEAALTSNDWFSDPRLSFPGQFRVRLFVPVTVVGQKVSRLRGPARRQKPSSPSSGASLAERAPVGNKPVSEAQSNEVTVTVMEPAGEDLLVWKRMLELSKGSGWTSVRWKSGPFTEIWKNHPTSGYFPYVAASIPGKANLERIDILKRAIEMDSDGPMANQLRRAVAWLYGIEARTVLNADLEAAVRLNDEARRTLRDTLKRADTPFIKQALEKDLEELPDREMLVELRGDILQ